MLSALLLLIPISFVDIIDIILVATLLYFLYNFIKGTAAFNIVIGISAVYFIWKLVDGFRMVLLSEILGQFISVGVIALMIVFQQEIRKALLMVGTTTYLRSGPFSTVYNRWKMSKQLFLKIDEIVQSCAEMSQSRTGALIVVTNQNRLPNYVESGKPLDAWLSKDLIKSIFFKNSPLHDGAIIVTDDKIKAARCILPLSDKTNLNESFGLRHRAALGITEQTDAITVLVSEQTGYISYCKAGRLHYNVSAAELKSFLKKENR